MKKIIILSLGILLLVNCSEEKKSSEQKRLTIETILEEYNTCQDAAETSHECKNFTARAICEYYGIDDLKKDGKYVDYPEIYEIVSTSPEWKNLGMATDQEVLDNAQNEANKGYAVVAINTNDEHKLAIMVIEGKQVKSGSWGASVPNCAAFFPANGPEPFINKTMNYAWSKPDGIQLWVRK